MPSMGPLLHGMTCTQWWAFHKIECSPMSALNLLWRGLMACNVTLQFRKGMNYRTLEFGSLSPMNTFKFCSNNTYVFCVTLFPFPNNKFKWIVLCFWLWNRGGGGVQSVYLLVCWQWASLIGPKPKKYSHDEPSQNRTSRICVMYL